MITPADSAPERAGADAGVHVRHSGPVRTPGSPQDIAFAGSGTSAGDDVAGTVAAAQAAAEARYSAHMQQTYGQGSSIGIPLTLPDVVSDHSLTTGGDGAGHPFEES
jgi:hypothetical protein